MVRLRADVGRMVKLFAVMFAAVLALGAPKQEETTMQDPVYTYTIRPNPLTQGGKCVIETDAPDGTVITLDWDPEAQPRTAKVVRGKVRVEVPSNATSLIASDQWGNTASAIVGP